MTCDLCIDGLVPLEWADPLVWAVCVCPAGQGLRVTRNEQHATAPRWRLWCAVWGVDPARVVMLEDIYTPEELALPQPVAVDREAALLAAASRRAKR